MKNNSQPKKSVTRVPIRLSDSKHPTPKPTEGKLGHLITFTDGRQIIVPAGGKPHYATGVEKIAFQPLNLFQK